MWMAHCRTKVDHGAVGVLVLGVVLVSTAADVGVVVTNLWPSVMRWRRLV